MPARSQRVLVSRPDGSERGRLGVDMLSALAQARDEGAAAWLLRPATVVDEVLLALTPADVPLADPRGATRVWLTSRWRARQWRARSRARLAAAASAFWLEWYKELRRHVSNERLPLDLRGRLREAAHRSFARSQSRGEVPYRFPRLRLRRRVVMRLPGELEAGARAEAAARGIDTTRPLVVFDTHSPAETVAPALDFLRGEGYSIVHLGMSPQVDLFVLLACEFLVCDSSDAQRAAYVTNTPTLAIGATDPFMFYPVRDDGLYLLKSAIDLDSGRALPIAEMLDEAYYRNLRNTGYREHDAADVLAAVREMSAGVRSGWSESDAQARYRARISEAGTALAARVRHVAKWGPEDGFVGDGRLAAVQADRLA